MIIPRHTKYSDIAEAAREVTSMATEPYADDEDLCSAFIGLAMTMFGEKRVAAFTTGDAPVVLCLTEDELTILKGLIPPDGDGDPRRNTYEMDILKALKLKLSKVS